MRTIKQHEPLRVPGNWNTQERQFAVQLERILDDLYSRFNRLKLSDLGKDLSSEITGTAEASEQNAGDIQETRQAVKDNADSVKALRRELENKLKSVQDYVDMCQEQLWASIRGLEKALREVNNTASAALKGLQEISNIILVEGGDPEIVCSGMGYYLCGVVNTISIVPPVNGVCNVTFTSGETAAEVTLPEWVITPEWWDGTTPNAQYRITVRDGRAGIQFWPI